MKIILLAIVWVIILIVIASEADGMPVGTERQPGYRYTALADDGCGIFVHQPTSWRPRKELHVACNVNAGAGPDGATFRYVYKGDVPRKFGVVIEDRTHGSYGDIPFIKVWREGRYGYVHIPGPNELRPKGVYIHIEHVYWNMFKGIKEDRL